jgi:hypothetical protein
MTDISFNIEGDISCGRGQLGLTNYITLSQPITQLWIDAGTNRPHRYYLTPSAVNNTIKMPAIGTPLTTCNVGHSVLIKNSDNTNTLNINDSSNILITTLQPGISVILSAKTAPDTWEIVNFGETITASNVGVGGVGLFYQKTGSILEFKNINNGSSKITVTDDVANREVDIDVNESAIPINNLSGTLNVSKGGTGRTTLDSGKVLVGNGTGAVITTKDAPAGDFVGTTDVQVITNKTITDSSNSVTADFLRTTGADVGVAAAAPPSIGQVLTATSATTANWQTPGGGMSSHRATYSMITFRTDATSVVYTPVSNFPWINARHSTYTNGIVLYNIIILGPKTIDIRLYDATNAVTLGSASVGVSAIGSFTVINPLTDADVQLQIRASVGGGPNPRLFASVLEYDF